MLCIAWQYLTGRCVATDFADRERVEWPPHPDRVFQTLVATWGERGEDPEERRALEWLESLGHPELVVPEPVPYPDKYRGPVKVYAPVNDIETTQKTYGEPMLSLLPERRDRKERYFPWIRVEDEPCALVWPEAEAGPRQQALERLCREVIRIGHSAQFGESGQWIRSKAAGSPGRLSVSRGQGNQVAALVRIPPLLDGPLRAMVCPLWMSLS